MSNCSGLFFRGYWPAGGGGRRRYESEPGLRETPGGGGGRLDDSDMLSWWKDACCCCDENEMENEVATMSLKISRPSFILASIWSPVLQ
jgi:hypothetical protein